MSRPSRGRPGIEDWGDVVEPELQRIRSRGMARARDGQLQGLVLGLEGADISTFIKILETWRIIPRPVLPAFVRQGRPCAYCSFIRTRKND